MLRGWAAVAVLTCATACGSPAVGQQHAIANTPADEPHAVEMAVIAIDAGASIDAPPPAALQCPADASIMYAPPADAETYCARADGTRNGPFARVFPDGGTRIAGSYANGALDGHWERHYPTGAVAEDGQYTAGKKTGHWRRLGASGNILGEYDLPGGTGVDKDWYDDGPIYREVAVKNGVANGVATTYAPDGTVLVHERFARGKLDGHREVGTKASMFISETFSHGVRYGARQIWQFWLLKYDENFDNSGRFDGAYTIWRAPKQPRATGQYKHGHRDGLWSWFDSDNHKEMEGTYDVGKKVGEWQEWNEQKLTFDGTYVDGKPDGTIVSYDHNGREQGRFDIKDGTGMWTTWQPNNHLFASREYLYKGTRDGLYQELVGHNKVVVEGHFNSGIKAGSWKEWANDGQLVLDEKWKRGKLDGAITKLVDGQPATQAMYKDGKAEGPYTELRNGKPALTGAFHDDLREGVWTTFDASGAAILIATYRAGVLDGPFHEVVGGVTLDGTMAHGRRAGVWTSTRAGVVTTLTYPP